MSADEQVASSEVLQRVIRIQTLTLFWMSVEVAAVVGSRLGRPQSGACLWG